MVDMAHAAESAIYGLLVGGGSAMTTWLATTKRTQNRLAVLEEQLGTLDPKTGFQLALSLVEDTVKRIKRELDSWDDTPPDWAKRVLARSQSSVGVDAEFEQRVDRAIKELRDRNRQIEQDISTDILHAIKKHMADDLHERAVLRDEYIKDSQSRAEEMLRVREQLAMVNGTLSGIMATLGYLNSPASPPERR